MPDDWRIPPLETPTGAIPTPALVVDVEALEANLTSMAGFFKDRPARLRPHFKTHKSPDLALRQMELGAIGLTCAKLGEAESLVGAGIPSVLIANQVVDPVKIKRLAELARQCELIVAVDEAVNLQRLSQAAQELGNTVHVVVEVNVGLNRCGVSPGEAAVSLAALASQLPCLRFRGVLGYEGHTVFEANRHVRSKNVMHAMELLVGTARSIERAGLPVDIVSAGGTGTYDQTGAYPGVTEVEAGSYVFMDSKYLRLGLPFKPALTLAATVISRMNPERAVIDAGMKALTTDNNLPQVVKPDGARLAGLSEEHGILEVDPQVDLAPGDRVYLIPSHICTTVNLHDRYYLVREGYLQAVWEIAGRGKTQ
jgi:D-serine deaminase-like pyridoxal phosphate-dependent protein